MTFYLKPFSFVVALIITGVFIVQSGIVDPVYLEELQERTENLTRERPIDKSQLIPQRKVKVAATGGDDRFTFFETLNDPGLNKFVDLDGKVRVLPQNVVDQLSRIAKPRPPQKKPVNEIKQKLPKKAVQPQAPPPALDHSLEPLQARVQQEIKGSFSVQVGSFKNIDSAIRLQRRLMYRGYPTYILTANISRKRRLWYRVYLGRFTSKRNAEIAAQRVRKEEKLNNVIHVAGK